MYGFDEVQNTRQGHYLLKVLHIFTFRTIDSAII